MALHSLAADAELVRNVSRSVSRSNERKYCQLSITQRLESPWKILTVGKLLQGKRCHPRTDINFACRHRLDRPQQFVRRSVFHPVTGCARVKRALGISSFGLTRHNQNPSARIFRRQIFDPENAVTIFQEWLNKQNIRTMHSDQFARVVKTVRASTDAV